MRVLIYESHSRKLLFDGDTEDSRITLNPPRHVVLDGTPRLVVNGISELGTLSLWVVDER